MTIAVTDPYYRVDVTAGARSWSTTKGDTADYGLADPVNVSWSLPNSSLFHAQPDPMVASFSVVVASMADASGVDRGDPVDLRVWAWAPGTVNPYVEASDLDPVHYPPVVVFRGRVTEVNAQPHKLGMIVTYSCADYTVDLSELTIGAGDWPVEGNDERLTRMFDEAGVLAPVPLYVGGSGPVYFLTSFLVAARNGSPQPARAAIWRLVDLDTDDTDVPYGTYAYMRPDYVGGLLAGTTPDPLAPYAVPFVNNRVDSGDTGEAPRLPGVFAITSPGLWGIDIVEHVKRRAAVISADHVDFKAQWAQTKRDAPDTITVTGTFLDGGTGTIYSSRTVQAAGAVPIGASLACEAYDVITADSFAAANLVAGDSDAWTADAFTWYADQDPWPLIADAQWFIEGAHVLASRAPIVVEGIPVDQNPTGVDWYAGRLQSAAFTLAGGRYSVRFRLSRSLLRPQNPDPATPGIAAGTLTCTSMRAAHPTVRTIDLDRAFSSFDYRLARSS